MMLTTGIAIIFLSAAVMSVGAKKASAPPDQPGANSNGTDPATGSDPRHQAAGSQGSGPAAGVSAGGTAAGVSADGSGNPSHNSSSASGGTSTSQGPSTGSGGPTGAPNPGNGSSEQGQSGSTNTQEPTGAASSGGYFANYPNMVPPRQQQQNGLNPGGVGPPTGSEETPWRWRAVDRINLDCLSPPFRAKWAGMCYLCGERFAPNCWVQGKAGWWNHADCIDALREYREAQNILAAHRAGREAAANAATAAHAANAAEAAGAAGSSADGMTPPGPPNFPPPGWSSNATGPTDPTANRVPTVSGPSGPPANTVPTVFVAGPSQIFVTPGDAAAAQPPASTVAAPELCASSASSSSSSTPESMPSLVSLAVAEANCSEAANAASVVGQQGSTNGFSMANGGTSTCSQPAHVGNGPTICPVCQGVQSGAASSSGPSASAALDPVFCPVCQMWLNGQDQWDDHRVGKKHAKNLRRLGDTAAVVTPPNVAPTPAPRPRPTWNTGPQMSRTQAFITLVGLLAQHDGVELPDPEVQSEAATDGSVPCSPFTGEPANLNTLRSQRTVLDRARAISEVLERDRARGSNRDRQDGSVRRRRRSLQGRRRDGERDNDKCDQQ